MILDFSLLPHQCLQLKSNRISHLITLYMTSNPDFSYIYLHKLRWKKKNDYLHSFKLCPRFQTNQLSHCLMAIAYFLIKPKKISYDHKRKILKKNWRTTCWMSRSGQSLLIQRERNWQGQRVIGQAPHTWLFHSLNSNQSSCGVCMCYIASYYGPFFDWSLRSFKVQTRSQPINSINGYSHMIP